MTYSIDIVHSVTKIAPADWNRLSGDHLYSSHSWYAFAETVLPRDKPVYLVVKSEGVPVARATFWIKYGDLLPLSSWRLTKIVNAYLSRRPLMICHAPLAGTDGLVLPDGDAREEVFDLMLDAAENVARQERASFLVMDYLPEELAKTLTFQGKLFPLKLSEPGTILSLPYASFEEYTQSLSKSERKNIRRAKNKLKKMGVTVRAEKTIADIDAALALIGDHDDRYRSDTYVWLRQAMQHLDEVESIWLGAYAGDKLVGCGLLLSDNDIWFATALGRDYDYPFVYFELGYQSIQQVIERGGKAIRWGTGNYKYKERLGFELEDNAFVSFAARNRGMDWLLRRISRWMV